MLERLTGLESEYAIRFAPAACLHPGNEVIYRALIAAVGNIVHTRPGERGLTRQQVFTQNGGAFYYESLPVAPDGGLLEGATPECRGPGQVLVYQRAQEALLRAAIPRAQASLTQLGFPGELALLKNCRDAEGHVYGAQESYEAEVAAGRWLLLYRLGLAFLLPVMLVQVVVAWVFLALLFVIGIAGFVAYGGALAARERLSIDQAVERASASLVRRLGPVSMRLEVALWWPLLRPFLALLRFTAFRRIRREALAFLVTRPILTGAGWLDGEGRFHLSEKGPAIGALDRRSVSPDDRPLFDAGNLCKMLMAPFLLRWSPVARLFGRRQRLQVGLSDANPAEVAEYLKVGTTSLVLDMVEAGVLGGAPRLRDPVGALHAIAGDPPLTTRVEVEEGEPVSALEVQRWYLDRARAFLHAAHTPSLEASEVVRLWGEALDGLARDPRTLFGKLDWVTKRSLLAGVADLPPAARKKVDLRYHELGTGYFARLEEAGLALRLTRDAEVEAAVAEPPANTAAFRRGTLVRALADSSLAVRVAWDSVRIGGPLRGKVVRLDERRPAPPSRS